MKKAVFFLLLAVIFFVASLFANEIPLSLTLASTPEQRSWGFMGRKEIPDNEAILFVFDEPQAVSMWALNCHVDLAVAFLNEEMIIQEVKPLYAYPDLMRFCPPLNTPHDVARTPETIALFFSTQAVKSKKKIRYVLELPLASAQNWGLKAGSKLLQKEDNWCLLLPISKNLLEREDEK